MDFAEIQTSRFSGLDALAINAVSSIIGFVSLFVFYKALASPSQGFSNVFRPFFKRYQAWAYGLNWFDRRCTEGVGFIRALRTLLTSNLSTTLPDLSCIIRTRFEELHAGHTEVDGVKHSPAYHMIVELVVLSNAVSFFGKDLAKDEQFMTSALAYTEETVVCAEMARLLPKFMTPLVIVGGIIARTIKSHEAIYNRLVPIVEQRCLERDLANLGQPVTIHIAYNELWKHRPRMPLGQHDAWYKPMAIWFGSVHAVSTTVAFSIYVLCLHPEYVDPLHREYYAQYADFEHTETGGYPRSDHNELQL
ncbi:uncharacterized protein K460DRAFT_406099 [Cucurbitaria berberidis CBS 394.84]|uniref:Cytochrome P450 n=1 Tax=Cucurbitaria berberidis CBS 394.84 TaxID=1168544 RepID=A0A9P4GI63_9PLEO|nr:uncharacterized protein K460DRAFT_406099 [Cucurbitaria berberidis CBS 394.84]KAF1845866.1 hypothetical protein K460DRAFT_406099 [Cucurbitaria berberidis CBS 394.84]